MKLPVIRPAKITDLNTLIDFSEESGFGITSLPRNPLVLEKKLHASEQAFREKFIIPTHETYQFCLEWEGRVIGTSGVISRVGMTEPFFSYHLLYEPQVCTYLGIDKRTAVLHFAHARKKPTELGSLYLDPAYRRNHFGKLLSFSRLLFIATFRSRFASLVIAELRGVNHDGISPFWEAIGRPFFQVGFPKADYLRTEHHACIEEIFPKHPLYVELLPKEAQEVIGVTHPDTIAAKKMLERQGFKMSPYLDLFDAGPHVFAHTEEIHAVKESKVCKISKLLSEMPHEGPYLISNTHLDFRVTMASLLIENGEVIFHPDVADALQVDVGGTIRYYTI